MAFIIILILVGLLLVLAEILLIPGVGVAGIIGLLSMGGSCFYAFHELGTTPGIIVTVINALLIVSLTIWVLRAKTWRRFTLNTNIDSKALHLDKDRITVGEKGYTTTRLAPMGSARFGDEIYEVKALEGMIDPEVKIEIVMIEDNRIYVRPEDTSF